MRVCLRGTVCYNVHVNCLASGLSSTVSSRILTETLVVTYAADRVLVTFIYARAVAKLGHP